ncbi:MAG: reverse transcriptase/maturase family protein [Lachnospiraceae bacterium]|nr:reverse transcriptase/maturase family protein [Butyrivibrio sp.]MCM1343014.1 reverse transcriptase/maturase family protein [Muribaculaceae bacterium]MCM1410745.1 reverse transcriptase/maturase family protein [Lachnospiraceae bacterium]
METNIVELAATRESWLAFLNEKKERQHLSHKEAEQIRDFIDRQGYLPLCEACMERTFPSDLPVKQTINKEGSRKKRVVYTFSGDEGIFLKFVAHSLNRYEDVFSDNCYAFRRRIGVKEAMERLRTDPRTKQSWCLKTDISNYFNSIDVAKLLPMLTFLQEKNPEVHDLLARLLTEERVLAGGKPIREPHGAMAGTPISPFLANLYLGDADRFFAKKGVLYLRYSDDILLFADSREELDHRQEQLYGMLTALGLSVNPDKVSVSAPGESFEFLGFAYRQGELDLSANTIRKTKAKIRRKSDALRRWQRRKELSPDKAAVGLIHTMNRKFYGCRDPLEEGSDEEDIFTWSRWFFPLLTTDRGLREIDAYMQEYVRYAATGRHYKGNYRISYEQMKRWGYVSLVHEFYQYKEHRKQNGAFN